MSEKMHGEKEVMPDGRMATWKVDANFEFDSGGGAGGVLDPRARLYCDDCKKPVKTGVSCTCIPGTAKNERV